LNNDYLDPINSVGMPDLADNSFALEFLMRAKNGVRNCAYAIAETATPDARNILREQLNESLALHDEIANLMINKHWLHPHQVGEQFKLDLKSADTTIKIANLDIFPKDTARLGLFATPDK
jgi:similar to spore coat protein